MMPKLSMWIVDVLYLAKSFQGLVTEKHHFQMPCANFANRLLILIP